MKKKTEKQPYDEAMADQVIAAYNLDPKVKKVWKTRGRIPGAYFVEGGVSESPTLAARDARGQRLVEILNRPEIAASKFRSLGQKAADVARGKSSLTEEEAIALIAEIVEIRNKVMKALQVPTSTSLRAAFTDVRLHPTKALDARLYSKITDTGRAPLTARELDEVKVRLIALRGILKI